jgi:hypothetical protein
VNTHKVVEGRGLKCLKTSSGKLRREEKMDSENLVLGYLSLIVGFLLMLFSKKVARFSVDLDKKVYKNVNPFQIKFRQVIYAIAGIALFLMGLNSIYHYYNHGV